MVISHKHRYLFIALPRTGSNAIAKELIEFYDGESILYKHATYKDFKKIFPHLAGKYFVFSCIRNPMDRVVSFYVKLYNGYYEYKLKKETDHNLYYRYYLLPKIKFVNKYAPSFEDFFLKYFRWPYSDWSILEHKEFDFVLKFENLNNDFQKVLEKIGLQSLRDLPVVNKTVEKSKNFEDFYSLRLQKRVIFVFGPHMEQLNYSLPEKFENRSPSFFSVIVYRLTNVFRKIYWLHIKSDPFYKK